MIVVDAGNNRLQVFDNRRTFLGFVRFNSKIARPSGIYLDKEAKFLYVLNLKSNSLVKVALIKKQNDSNITTS
jgi:DNA-binding beta-propeller fold protein YncE